ncbi:MAG TPA: FtsX-like permease family protein [Casimicrobiaceae bacterium]
MTGGGVAVEARGVAKRYFAGGAGVAALVAHMFALHSSLLRVLLVPPLAIVLALAVASLTVLVAIERGFHGVLVDTLLGNALSIQVRAVDIAAAAIIMSLAALAVADVLYLNLRERAAELATLRATGWTRGHVARLVCLEALAVGALIAAAIALAAALVAAAVPTAQALAAEPARVLAAE